MAWASKSALEGEDGCFRSVEHAGLGAACLRPERDDERLTAGEGLEEEEEEDEDEEDELEDEVLALAGVVGLSVDGNSFISSDVAGSDGGGGGGGGTGGRWRGGSGGGWCGGSGAVAMAAEGAGADWAARPLLTATLSRPILSLADTLTDGGSRRGFVRGMSLNGTSGAFGELFWDGWFVAGFSAGLGTLGGVGPLRSPGDL